jgi:tRNA A-37 threonylcarbamoyl transferase component Bud32
MKAEGPEDLADLPFLLKSSDPSAIGRISNYKVLSVLGRGGMGIVLDAFDTLLHRRVAIKVLSPQLATSRKAHRRFLREARAAAAINHANVVTIHAVDEQAGMPYLVMEYVPGRTLQERIRLGSPLDLTTHLRISAQIAAGLAAAHRHGVIHRDIKPANILLEDGIERVKITDFGLALVALDASQVSSADRPVGTPAYMSPEQVGGGRVDARSDLFSLGCVMYAMITAKSPFQGSNVLVIARNVAEYTPPPLAEVNPNTPRFLSEIVSRLLAKNPNDRFESAEEVHNLLLQHSAAANQGSSDLMAETIPQTLPRRKPRRWLAMAVVLLVLGSLCAAAAYFGHVLPFQGAPVVPGATLTVAQAEPADFRNIQDALARAGPGAIIRILDAGVYDGPLLFNDAGRLRDITLEAPQRAILENSSSLEPVVSIDNTPGVLLSGMRIRARHRQHCISVRGACEGLIVDGVRLDQPSESPTGCIVLWQGTHGSSERPMVLCNLDLHCGEIGIVVIGTPEKPASWLRVENSRFTGPGVHVAMEASIRDITVVGNIFTNGLGGVSLGFERPRQMQRLAVSNNTFFQMTSWLALENCSLDQGEVIIANNLVLESDRIKLTGQDLASVAPQWFRNNWWERSDRTDKAQAQLVADVRPPVALISREPAHVDFLRPAPVRMLENGGNDGADHYIGALAPAKASLAPRVDNQH